MLASSPRCPVELSGSMSQRPPSAPERPSTIAEALDRAALALRTGRFDEAERLAAGVLKSNRGAVAAAQVLGQALLLQQRPEAAIEALRGAARLSRDPSIETLLGVALADSGRGDEALAQLRQATGRRPAYPLAFLELGDRLGRLGRFDEAAAVFGQGLALTPDAAVLRIGLAYINLHRNDRATARRLFAEVRAAAPQRHDAVLGLAHVTSSDGDYAAAAGLYRQALDLRPDDAQTRISLGRCLLEMGERDAGEAALRAAARGGAQLAGPAITALAATPHGRMFLRPSAAADFLRRAPD
jgi:tetratricopeptide (TPR) repeat protein